jgi:TIR domain
LLVSAREGTWDGDPWTVDLGRCVREYTDTAITQKFGELDTAAVNELKKLPCVFAYETIVDAAPQFGVLKDITKRQGQVRIEYEIQSVEPFLSAEDLAALTFELDLSKWELSRTHWAVKAVNLAKELRVKGIVLPAWVRDIAKAVDITTHEFSVALSFPGEMRAMVEQVAQELERRIGPNSYFYDNNYVSQLARPSLDDLLQDIYRNRAKLIVIFLGSDYQRKDWCGIEFRAIKEIIMSRDHKRIMFVRMDDGTVQGVLKTDGYVDGRKFSPADVARFIHERVNLLV